MNADPPNSTDDQRHVHKLTGYQPVWDELARAQLRLPRFKVVTEEGMTRVFTTSKPPRWSTRLFWCVVALMLAGSTWMIVIGFRKADSVMIASGFLALFWLPLMGMLPWFAVAHNAHTSESLKGDLLRIDHGTARVELPRFNRSFDLNEIQAIEVIDWRVRVGEIDYDKFRCIDLVLRLETKGRPEWVRFGCKPMLKDLQLIQLANLMGVRVEHIHLGTVQLELPPWGSVGYM